MGKVDILLATYNGEKYIEQQLLSLIAQTEKDWNCYIHDDGSSDGTIEIIKKWCRIDSRFKYIEDGVQLKNPCDNFLHLLNFSESDFICFCDQDDIWLDNKLEVLFNCIVSKDNSIPQVVFSNGYFYFSDTNRICGGVLLKKTRSIKDFLFYNGGFQGASSIFNREMLYVLKKRCDFMYMHDYYLSLAGLLLGNISFLDDKLMLYRQHGKNVTGYQDTNMFSKYKMLLKRKKNKVIDIKHFDSLSSFCSCWSSNIKKQDFCVLKDFLKLKNKTKLYAIFIVFKHRLSIYNSTTKLIIKILLRPLI